MGKTKQFIDVAANSFNALVIYKLLGDELEQDFLKKEESIKQTPTAEIFDGDALPILESSKDPSTPRKINWGVIGVTGGYVTSIGGKVIGGTTQNLWETIVGDSGSIIPNSPTKTLSVLGTGNTNTSVANDTIVINSPIPDIWKTFTADYGSVIAAGPSNTLVITGAGTVSTSIVGNVLTITGLGDGSGTTQNLWKSVQADSGISTALSPNDILSILGAGTISTSIIDGILTITGIGTPDQNVFTSINAEVGSMTALSPSSSINIIGDGDISTSISGNTITITGTSSPGTTQNLWQTIAADLGSSVAQTPLDTLQILGSGSIDTSIEAGVLYINGGGEPNQNLFSTFYANSGMLAANAVDSSMNIVGSNGISTSFEGNVLTINGAYAGEQDIWKTIVADVGMTSASTPSTVLQVSGQNGISTEMIGNELVIYGSGSGLTIFTDNLSGLSVNDGNSSSDDVMALTQNDSKLGTRPAENTDYIGFWDVSEINQQKMLIQDFPGWLLSVENIFKTEVNPGDGINIIGSGLTNVNYSGNTLYIDTTERFPINTHESDAFIAYNDKLYSYDISEGTSRELLGAPSSYYLGATTFGEGDFIYTASGNTIYQYQISTDTTIASVTPSTGVLMNLTNDPSDVYFYALFQGRCFRISKVGLNPTDWGDTIVGYGTGISIDIAADGSGEDYLVIYSDTNDRFYYKKTSQYFVGTPDSIWTQGASHTDRVREIIYSAYGNFGIFGIDNYIDVPLPDRTFQDLLDDGDGSMGYTRIPDIFNNPSGYSYSGGSDELRVKQVSAGFLLSNTPIGYARVVSNTAYGDSGIYVDAGGDPTSTSGAYEQAFYIANPNFMHVSDFREKGVFDVGVDVIVAGRGEVFFHGYTDDPKQFTQRSVKEVSNNGYTSTDITDDITWAYYDNTYTGGGSNPNEPNIISYLDLAINTTIVESAAPTLDLIQGEGIAISYVGSGGKIKFDVTAEGAIQNLWETIIADSGTTTASTPTGSLTINGSGGITTTIVGDTLTINGDGIHNPVTIEAGSVGYLSLNGQEISIDVTDLLNNNITPYSFFNSFKGGGAGFANAVYSGVSYDLVTPLQYSAFTFGNSGNSVYITTGSDVIQYFLSTPYDLNTITGSYTYTRAEQSGAVAIHFNPTGTRMYVLTPGRLHQYSLSTAWSLSTTSFIQYFVVPFTSSYNSYGMSINSDGTTLLLLSDSRDKIVQFTFGTPWDVSTLTDSGKSIPMSYGYMGGMKVLPNGTTYYVLDKQSDTIYQHEMSSAWDISTSTYSGISLTLSGETNGAEDIVFDNLGYLYVLSVEDIIYKYTLEVLVEINDKDVVYYGEGISGSGTINDPIMVSGLSTPIDSHEHSNLSDLERLTTIIVDGLVNSNSPTDINPFATLLDLDNYDNYIGWGLYVDDVLESTVTTGQGVNLKSGSSISLIYSPSNNTITINASGTTDNDAIHTNIASEFVSIVEKTVLADNDWLILEDSAAGFVKKKLRAVNLPGAGAGISSAYVGFTDGIDSMSASGADTVKILTNDGLVNVSIVNDDPIHGDYINFNLSPTVATTTWTTDNFEAKNSGILVHINDITTNPHQIDKSDIGLDQVPNRDTTLAVDNQHVHNNKPLLDSYTQTNINISEAVSWRHQHSNKELLDSYTHTNTEIGNAIAANHSRNDDDYLDFGGIYQVSAQDLKAHITDTSNNPHQISKTSVGLSLVPNLNTYYAVTSAHEHDNKPLLDSYDQSNVNITNAITKAHEHANLILLETYTQTDADISEAVSWKHVQNTDSALDLGGANEVTAASIATHIVNLTNPHRVTKLQIGLGSVPDLDTTDAVNNEHTHADKPLLDTYTQTNDDLSYAVSNSHIHTNKSELDTITTNISAALVAAGSPTALNPFVTLSDLGDLGGGDMTKDVYDTNNNGNVDTADNSVLVNGLSVETAVPLGALFTDTVYDHSTYRDLDFDSIGAQVIDTISLLDGHIVDITTRNLIATDIGALPDTTSFDNYVGWNLFINNSSQGVINKGEAVNFEDGNSTTVTYGITPQANSIKINHAVSSWSMLALSGASVISDINVDSTGHISEVVSRDITLGDLGYTGAINANYITDNNQLLNGAGYTTNIGDITGVTAGSYLTGGGSSGTVTLNVDASTASTASKVVARDSSGDINARLFRSEYDSTNGTIGYIMTQVDTISNNYIRPSTPAQFRAAVTDGIYAAAIHPHNYDNYNGWDLRINGVYNKRITSGEDLGFTGGSNVTVAYDGTDISISAINTVYTHPSFTARSINTSGASVLDVFTSDSNGHVTSITTRTLTLSDLGYTGATDANNYSHPAYTSRSINTSGASVLDTFTSDSSGHVTGITTRSLTAGDIGAAISGHTHSYLPLSGGTLTGDLTISKTTPVLTLANASLQEGTIYFGNSSHGIKRNYASGANNVGFFTTSGNLYLSVSGSSDTNDFVLSSSGVSIQNNITALDHVLSGSDIRLKENIVKPDLSWVDSVKIVSFNMKTSPDKVRYGVIAQDLQKYAPDLVQENENSGMLTVSYTDYLVAKVARLEERVEVLEKIIENGN